MSVERIAIITPAIAAKVLATVDAGLCSGPGVPEPGKMCVEAAVCYALGLPHGDNPSCVSPALRSFKIKLNDASWSSDKARAKGLRRLALVQLGSAGHLDDREFVRRLADLAIRQVVPAALRAAASVQKDPNHKAVLLAHAATCEREGNREAALSAKKAAFDAAAASASAAAAYASAYTYTYPSAYTYAAYAYAASAAAYAYAAYAASAAADASADASDAASAAAFASAASAYAYAAASAAADASAASASAASAAAAADASAYAADASAAADKLLADFAEAVVQILVEMNAPGVQWLDLAPIAETA